MNKILNITNGDSAADLIREADIEGHILPWRDVLHDGPVPMGLDLKALSSVRANFIADRNWAPADEVRRDFARRDQMLVDWRTYDKIRLWFEHDLYDQLQILQVLDFFAREDGAVERLSLICTDNYLGYLSPAQMIGLQDFEQPVSLEQLDLSSRAWAAFREPDPLAWHTLLNQDTSGLPYLEGAVRRMFDEYPAIGSGLGRTEQQALDMLAVEPTSMADLFSRNQRAEERVFLGDWSYLELLQQMADAETALISTMDGSAEIRPDTRLELTVAGQRAQQGVADPTAGPHWTMRWIGGVCMTRSNHWRREGNGSLLHRCDKSVRITGPVTLRSYPGGDASQLRHCAQAAYAPYIRRFGKPPMPMLDDYADLPGDREVYIAAGNRKGIAGFLILNPTSERMVLENMAVHPDAQGAGLGGRMMDLAEVRAKALGYPAIELYTHRDLAETRALYQGRGYAEVDSNPDQGSQRIHLKKTLG